MSIVERAKNILLKPASEWEVIADEPATPVGLLTGYALPLAAIAAVIGIISAVLFGAALASMLGGAVGAISTVSALITGAVGFVLGLGLVFAMGYIVSALAPSFGGVADPVQGAKLIIYSGTAVWVAGFLAIIPVLGSIVGIAGLCYACYLIAIGVRPLLKIPQDKTAGMVVVTLLIYFVGAVVVGLINASLGFAGMAATAGAIPTV